MTLVISKTEIKNPLSPAGADPTILSILYDVDCFQKRKRHVNALKRYLKKHV